MDNDTTRQEHTLKLIKPRARLNIRLQSFSHRVINSWNKLPLEIINCQTLDNFKYKLSRYLSTNSG